MTDGAAVMKKVGRLLEVEQQLCLSHGAHLAVCNLLYNTSPRDDSPSDSKESSGEDDEDADETETAPTLNRRFQPVVK